MTTPLSVAMTSKPCLRDPLNTDLGKRIVLHSVEMIDRDGFEQFTFRKLANQINSTEASIYRYFESKHLLLIYLISMYWSDLYSTAQRLLQNTQDSEEQLRILLKLISGAECREHDVQYIQAASLSRIIITEASKSYLTHKVDEDHKKGYFAAYMRFANLLAEVIADIAPHYAYPHALASTLLEASHYEVFFSEHLPSLTDFKKDNMLTLKLYYYLEDIAFKTIKPSQALMDNINTIN